MSFRPTISIYLDGRIVDCGYYRNWSEAGLASECIRLVRLLDGCGTRGDVMEHLGRTGDTEAWESGAEHQFYMSSPYAEEEKRHDSLLAERACPLSVPTSYCEDEELLAELESLSELPIIIDLTDRCIRWGFEGLELPYDDFLS